MKNQQPRMQRQSLNMPLCKREHIQPSAALDFIWAIATLLGCHRAPDSRHSGGLSVKPSRTYFIIFFCCIAELAIKPCRSSRSKLRGEFGIPKHLQNRKQKHNKATNTPNPKHNTKQKEHGKCLECETRGEKRVKRPKRPNALICRTPGGSIRYPLSCSLGMMLISHSIVSIPASPSWFAI